MSSVLEFCEITKEYRNGFGRRRQVALDHLNLAVERGEIFGFLGANGAGKTTAIHLAMGFMRPTAGSGKMLGQPFGDVATHASVGFLGENFALYPRTAEQLLHLYGALNGMRDPCLRERVRAVLHDVDLQDRAGDNVKRMSRGTQQRIGLAQALLNDPEMLILDEPTSALDPFARIGVRELLLRARERGKTVFLSSHLLSEVEQVCDRVAILRKGQLVRVSPLRELLEEHQRYEIWARGVPQGLRESDVLQDGVAKVTVAVEAQREAIERIWAAGGEVVSVNPVRRSLEDVFVDLASQDEQGRQE